MSKFTERQTGWRAVLVQGDNHSILMDLYDRVLQVMEGMLDTSLFMFGGRPSLADFGLYAQLSQCAIDPSASAIMRASAPRTFQWIQTLDDCSGIDGEWTPNDQLSPAVHAMLQLIGAIYLPFLLANANAIAIGAETFTAPIGDRFWQGRPERYKLKCLIWLRRELAKMSAESREELRPVLEQHQCWGALQEDELNLQPVPGMAPM